MTNATTTHNTHNDTRLVRMVRDPFTNEMIPSPTLIQQIRNTSNELHSLRAQRRTHNESALLMHSAFILSLVCVSLIGATATVKDFNYVAVIAGLSALGFMSLGFGIVSSINARHNARQIKIAQRKMTELIHS